MISEREKGEKGKTDIESLTSQTVEKWPQLIEIGEIGAGREEEKKGNIPELPKDGISSVFEQVGGLDLQIAAIVVVCG